MIAHGSRGSLVRRLSFAAVNPTLFARARAGGPLSQHAAATRRPGDGPVFGGLAGGVATLVEALAADLAAHGVEIRRDATVRALVRGHGPGAGGGYRLTVGSTRDAYPVSAPAVVLALTRFGVTPEQALGGAVVQHLC